MKKLYKIVTRHCAPKDCKDSIYGYVLADNENDVLAYVNRVCTYGSWQDKSDEDGMRDMDDYYVIDQESYMEFMLRIRGEFNDEDYEYTDLYYGLTLYGWEEGIDINEETGLVLLKYGVAVDIA